MKFEYTETFQFQLELSQAICKKIAEIDKTDISKTEIERNKQRNSLEERIPIRSNLYFCLNHFSNYF